MPNYGRERLNSSFSITIYRTQYSKLDESRIQGLNDTTHLMNTRLIGFKWDYRHAALNSRISLYISKWIKNSILKNIELEDTTHLKDTLFMEFMQNYGHDLTRLKGLNDNINS
ncbi:hypothetical protein MTR67_012384 [Solanum verrucosum]|uniref:Uncharacterized protein n=1 Tax=Solanum verrucosum TaxID=315347 RepID=A0AAF0THG4_SOLVR|nr:hypothetical protein MTR67_012384 [Solanum verrucosum]